MPLWPLALIALAALAAGYLLYGKHVARRYALDDNATTPATAKADGVDFIPTKPLYLLAQHLSAIAAAGPIAGPILACLAFGWLPALLWILLGVVFIGAVHDLSALIASVRHGAHSIADVARTHLGQRAWITLAAFIWLAMLYIVVAFTQITAASFVGKSEELEGLQTTFNKGGAVAMASTLYLGLAVILGLVQRFLKPPLWLVTVIFVPTTLACVYAGMKLDTLLNLGASTWYVLILAYCLVASMLPVWVLQQPRGYLGGWVLYLVLIIGILGLLAGGFTVQQPAITDSVAAILTPAPWQSLATPGAPLPVTSLIFPFLFVTIACGACSGFHGLICGGTTSKQIAKESHCRSVGFGAMLLEGLIAVIALATVMIILPADAKGQSPATIYGQGIARFLTTFLGPDAFLFCATFGAMAFSTFVFDTLDITTRLGRYLLAELTGKRTLAWGLAFAALTCAAPLAILLTSDPEGYRLFWTLFGSANQLLAALTLMGVAVWLKRTGKARAFVVIPMLLIAAVSVAALGLQAFVGVRDLAAGIWRTPTGALNPAILNAPVALALLALAGLFAFDAHRAASRA